MPCCRSFVLYEMLEVVCQMYDLSFDSDVTMFKYL